MKNQTFMDITPRPIKQANNIEYVRDPLVQSITNIPRKISDQRQKMFKKTHIAV